MRRQRVFLALALVSLAPSYALSQKAASPIPYPGADLATRKILVDCDGLVEQGQYRAAFEALAPAADDSDLVIAKRIELSLKHGVRSLDRAEISYDPVEAAARYYASRPRSALLEKGLGDYYFDAFRRSGSGRAAGDEAAAAEAAAGAAASHYEAAFRLGLEDAPALADCAECQLALGAYDKAAERYERAFELGEDSAEARYGAAFACLRSGYAAKALDQARKAIAGFAGDPARRFDALLLAADASGAKGDLAGGLGYLDAARQIDSGDYRLYDRSIRFRLAGKDVANALADAGSLFGLSPRSPGAAQLVMEAFEGAGRKDLLPGFFDRALGDYAEDPEALGNLLFHYSLVAYGARDGARARSLVARAEEAFQRSGTENPELLDAISRLREAYGE
jgi:hypothetical protein